VRAPRNHDPGRRYRDGHSRAGMVTLLCATALVFWRDITASAIVNAAALSASHVEIGAGSICGGQRLTQLLLRLRPSGPATRVSLLVAQHADESAQRTVASATSSRARDALTAGLLGRLQANWSPDLAMNTWSAVPGTDEYLARVGVRYYERGDEQEAISLFAYSIRLHPEASPGRVRMYECLCDYSRRYERLQEALQWCGAWAELRPGPWGSVALAETRLGLGDVDQALDILWAADARWPGNEAVVTTLALALERKGSFGEAIGVLERALEADPHNAWVNYVAGVLYQQVGRDRDAYCAYLRAVEFGSVEWRIQHARLSLESLDVAASTIDCSR